MRETRVRFLGQEDPLEKEMAIHASTLAWKIPWMEEPDRLQSMGLQRVRHDWTTWKRKKNGSCSSHVWMWDHKESWVLKNWCFQTVVLEKTLESSLDSKEIKPVNLKRNQPWIFIHWKDGAKAPILWPPDAKSQLIGKDPDTGKDWRQEEKRVTENEMVGWHHWLNGHELEQTQGDSEGQLLQPMGSQRVGHD